MPHFFSIQTLDSIADALVEKGYIVLDINDLLMTEISTHVRSLENFSQASIGRDRSKQEVSDIRSDEILWLDDNSVIDHQYLKEMQLLQNGMNQRLYMGLHYHEAHYAHYRCGSLYKKHLDAFKGRSSRKLTTVLYLNKGWKKDDGGELVIYDDKDQEIVKLLPALGRMVIFLSDRFPHEVLPAIKDRYSIAGWFRID
jgi:SM-20-related protein